MVVQLQEIKAGHEGKCHKCLRVIRTGWTIYYDASMKVAYCKPCAQTMPKGDIVKPPDSSGSDSEMLLNELAGNIKLTNEMLGAFSLSLKGINEELAEIKKLLKAKAKEK